jgi:predicted enzyme related to lactoylglutathione lyase
MKNSFTSLNSSANFVNKFLDPGHEKTHHQTNPTSQAFRKMENSMFFYEKYLQPGEINSYSYSDLNINRRKTISLDCRYLVIRVMDIARTKDFYIHKLGLTLLDEQPGFLATQAGQIRLFFLGGFNTSPSNAEQGTSVMFTTQNIQRTRDEIIAKGLSLVSDITTSYNSLQTLVLKDPDGNLVNIAQLPEADDRIR